MALSYPLAAPTVKGPSGVEFGALSAAGMSQSPITFEQQVYVHPGMLLTMEVRLPPMKRAAAEEWVAFLLALNGHEGTFLMGDTVNTSPRGTWAGSPLVNGSHAARARSIAMDGFTAGATVKAGDWFQVGSGASTHLHKIVQDATANGSGVATLEIWPSLRATLADNASLTTASPKGLWRLAGNASKWSIELAQSYGLSFSAIEAV